MAPADAGGHNQKLVTLLCVFSDIGDSVANSANLLSLVVGDGDAKFLFELHNQFYSVERVCTKVVGEAWSRVLPLLRLHRVYQR